MEDSQAFKRTVTETRSWPPGTGVTKGFAQQLWPSKRGRLYPWVILARVSPQLCAEVTGTPIQGALQGQHCSVGVTCLPLTSQLLAVELAQPVAASFFFI